MARQQVHVLYSGRVQGVGFRFTVKSLVVGFDVTGTIRNLDDGRVELLAAGERQELNDFLQAIEDSGLRRFIRNREAAWSEPAGTWVGFEIVA